MLVALPCNASKPLSGTECALISESGQTMRVLTINNRDDSLLLRRKSESFTKEDLRGGQASTLAAKMIATVTSPEQDGVGIAAPQVGLSRRAVAVQRFDKQGEPFEVYFNIKCKAATKKTAVGTEGCLSVPGRRGTVCRYTAVRITYTDSKTLRRHSETVSGFTAVIFQHETDHLKGILYIDRLTTE